MGSDSVEGPTAWVLSEEGSQVQEKGWMSCSCVDTLCSVVFGSATRAVQNEAWDVFWKADARISQCLLRVTAAFDNVRCFGKLYCFEWEEYVLMIVNGPRILDPKFQVEQS